MTLWELVLIACALSMDAFAVSICKGLSVKEYHIRYSLLCGLYFGFFQGFMPFLGFILGSQAEHLIASIDHWIAFVLLSIIGIQMIRESRQCEKLDDSFAPKAMLILAIATSIDALAIGVTFSFLAVNIWYAVSLIGVITFIFSAIGVKMGAIFGCKYKGIAELTGGIVLILMGTKILIEHLMA